MKLSEADSDNIISDDAVIDINFNVEQARAKYDSTRQVVTKVM
jgi:hypothetical protein